MKGVEIAWRTLAQERIGEPCIVGTWIMKGDFYTHFTGRDYWRDDKEDIFLQAMPQLGVNLCPQYDVWPKDKLGNAGEIEDTTNWGNRLGLKEPEQILPMIEALPSDEELEREYDVEGEARNYAQTLKAHIDAVGGEVLFIGHYGFPSFMGPYNEWGYVPYLSAMALYPDHLARYFHYTATKGYLWNLAIVEAVKRHGIAPFVYGGQDICDNAGPLASAPTLDRIFFPELRRCIRPLVDNDVRIIWHCDGNIMPILERLIELGMSGLQGFEEEAGVPYERMVTLKTKKGLPMIIWGCVSVTTTLPFGTVEDVKASVRRSFELAGPGRGFGLASTSSIMPEVPDENIEALYHYGRQFGREFLGT